MSEQERQEIPQDTDEAYPLEALKNMVVFPRTRMTLAIAREKSVRAIEEAMMRPDHALITASQHDPDIDDPQPKDIYPMGALVEITTMHRQHDGSLQVLLSGIRRVKIEEYLDLEPFMRVRMNVPQEPQARGRQADALVRHATNLFERYAQLNRRFSVEDINSIVAIKTAARLSDMLAAHLVTDPQQQQDLLETLDRLERLEKICVIMGNEIEILELESTIRSRVRSQVDRTKQEYYLREQLRAIQEELGMETTSEVEELRARVNEKHLPAEAMAKIRKEIDRLERTPAQSAEVAVLRSYIDWVLALPWDERTQDHFELEETRRILDMDHYGLEGIKERIIEFLAVRQLRQRLADRGGHTKSESQGQILCFIGPPGVGKTSLGHSIANALGRKFARISLGGVHDEAEIRGHRRTYVGALPGRIIQSMKTVGVKNPVFLLDEIDKLSAEYRGDPAAALLEVLDPEQNNSFTDHYLEGPVVQKVQVVVAMGLAVKEMGGILLPVEVATMTGKGELLITGQLGEVMRESAYAALSYIRSRAEELEIDPNFQDSTDLHIHMPENALPKDGPSAGITIATVLISALTGRPIRSGLARTGEIPLLA